MLWTVVLDKTLESPLDSKEIKPINLKKDKPWVITGRTDAEAKAALFWYSDEKSWLIKKSLMLRKIEGWKRQGH